MERLKIAIVHYKNTLPFEWGLCRKGIDKLHELHFGSSATCAEQVTSGTVDMGIIPVAALFDNPHLDILLPYCIAGERTIRTVCLYSELPIEQTQRVWLDYESRSGVLLAKVLLTQYWGLRPTWLDAQPNYEREIQGSTSAVMIGDKVFEMEKREGLYVYDLCKIWRDWTGLPFVFAVWAGRNTIHPESLTPIKEALEYGIDHKQEAIQKNHLAVKNIAGIKEYITETIAYRLTSPMEEAIEKFRQLAQKLKEDEAKATGRTR